MVSAAAKKAQRKRGGSAADSSLAKPDKGKKSQAKWGDDMQIDETGREDVGDLPDIELIRPWYMLDPTSRYVMTWQSVLAVAILYNVLVIPVRIGFEENAPEGSVIFYIEFCMDMFFIVDLFQNFWVGFEKDGTKIYEWNRVACNYIKGWLIIDLSSSFPIELVMKAVQPAPKVGEASGKSNLGSQLKMLRFLRLFRLLKLMRLLKLGKMLDMLEDAGINSSYIKLISMLMNLLFIAHILGCFWYFISTTTGVSQAEANKDANDTLEAIGWVTGEVVEGGYLETKSLWPKLMTSWYWAITTLTTVGYGDINAGSGSGGEKIYCLVCMLAGATAFGFIIGNLAELISSINERSTAIREELGNIRHWTKDTHMPSHLATQVNDYFEFALNLEPTYNEADILKRMPFELRSEAVECLLECLKNQPLFRGAGPVFNYTLFPLFRIWSFPCNFWVMKCGDLNHHLLYVRSGKLEVTTHSFKVVREDYGEQSFLGVWDVLPADTPPHIASIRSMGNLGTDVWWVERKALNEMLEENPHLLQAQQRAIVVTDERETTERVKEAEVEEAEVEAGQEQQGVSEGNGCSEGEGKDRLQGSFKIKWDIPTEQEVAEKEMEVEVMQLKRRHKKAQLGLLLDYVSMLHGLPATATAEDCLRALEENPLRAQGGPQHHRV